MPSDAWQFTVRDNDIEIIADFDAGTYAARLDGAASTRAGDNPALAQTFQPAGVWSAKRSFTVAPQTIWPTFRQWLQILRAWGTVHWIMRRPPRDWISWFRRKPGWADGSEDRIGQLVAVFHTAATLLPGLSRCLPRSMALLDFLACNGIRCHWIFAVRPVPFEAHCWVQWQDLVLTDHVDHADWFAVFLVID